VCVIAQAACSCDALFGRRPISHLILSVESFIEQGNSLYAKYLVNKGCKLWSRRLAQIQQKRVSA
jgi:hypothetical protein